MKKIFYTSCFCFAFIFLFLTDGLAFQVTHLDLSQRNQSFEQQALIEHASNIHFDLDRQFPRDSFAYNDTHSSPNKHRFLIAQNGISTELSDINSNESTSTLEGDELEEEGESEEEEEDDFEDEFGDVEAMEVYDPLSGYNRFMTSANDGLYTWILIPVSKGWEWLIPACVRRGFVRFFNNLLYPVRLVNNLLQGKFKNSGEETLRFAVNSTIGIFGIFDPAKEWLDLEAHPEDFGQTLGYWGVGAGPHLVIPFLGPSNLRDAFSLFPDYIADPTSTPEVQFKSLEDFNTRWAYWGFNKLNYWSFNYKLYEGVKKDAIDLYPYLRDFYEQSRLKDIAE